HKLEKLGISPLELFMPYHELKQRYIDDNTENGYHLDEEKTALEELFQKIKTRAVKKDKSLEGFVGAEATKSLKSLDNISKRLQRAEEKNQEVALKQLEGLKEKLFPGGGLQERSENILNFYINSPEIISFILLN